jgi:hypothetical protein
MLQIVMSDLGLAEDKAQWQVHVNMEMKFLVP